MGNYDFMEEHQRKLEQKAEKAEKTLQDDLKAFLEKERQKLAKDIRSIYSETGQGSPDGELGEVFRHGADRFVSDDD